MDTEDLKKIIDQLTGGEGIVTDFDGLKRMIGQEPNVIFNQAVLLGRKSDAQVITGLVLSSDERCKAHLSIDFSIDIPNDEGQISETEEKLRKVMSFVASFADALHKSDLRLLGNKSNHSESEGGKTEESKTLTEATRILSGHSMPSTEAFIDLFEQMPHILHFAQDVLMVKDKLLDPPESAHIMYEFFLGMYDLMDESKEGLMSAVLLMETRKREEEEELKKMDAIPSLDSREGPLNEEPEEDSNGESDSPDAETPSAEPTDT